MRAAPNSPSAIISDILLWFASAVLCMIGLAFAIAAILIFNVADRITDTAFWKAFKGWWFGRPVR